MYKELYVVVWTNLFVLDIVLPLIPIAYCSPVSSVAITAYSPTSIVDASASRYLAPSYVIYGGVSSCGVISYK